jgi:gas vesicle protein
MAQNNKNVKGFFYGLLAGGAIGSVVALLTAPKSGKKMRKKIKQKTDEYFDEVDKYLAETKQATGKVLNESKRKFMTVLEDIKSKPEAMYKGAEKVFNNAKGKTIDVFNSGKDKVEAETERLTSSVKVGMETYNDEKK